MPDEVSSRSSVGMKKRNPPRRKHVPQRTCVACQVTRNKRELVRIVRTPAGPVEVDLTGKKAGRGAYLCKSAACWEKALRKRHLEYALQTTITHEDRAALMEYARTLPSESEETTSSL